MDRPALLAVPTALVAALVVPLRTLIAFVELREHLDAEMVTLLSRPVWTLVAVLGFAAAGYVYGMRTETPPAIVLAVATLAALVGTLLGSLFLGLTTDVRLGVDSMLGGFVMVSTFSILDALKSGLMVLGGYALTFHVRPSTN